MILDHLKNNRFIRKVYAFNLAERDEWIKRQSKSVPNGSDVLDVGAGSCPYRRYFAHCNYFTQDVAQLLPEQLRDGGYGNIDYVCDATQVPVPDSSFDVILCTEMLEHHPEPVRVIREFARILRNGGVLILTAPLGSGIHQEPFHYYGGYTPYWYKRFLSEAGFTDLEIKENGGFFRFFGQESLRFVQLSKPSKIKANVFLMVIWIPVWALLSVCLGILMPAICFMLDPCDRERRFTVGYHVRAIYKNIAK